MVKRKHGSDILRNEVGASQSSATFDREELTRRPKAYHQVLAALRRVTAESRREQQLERARRRHAESLAGQAISFDSANVRRPSMHSEFEKIRRLFGEFFTALHEEDLPVLNQRHATAAVHCRETNHDETTRDDRVSLRQASDSESPGLQRVHVQVGREREGIRSSRSTVAISASTAFLSNRQVLDEKMFEVAASASIAILLVERTSVMERNRAKRRICRPFLPTKQLEGLKKLFSSMTAASVELRSRTFRSCLGISEKSRELPEFTQQAVLLPVPESAVVLYALTVQLKFRGFCHGGTLNRHAARWAQPDVFKGLHLRMLYGYQRVSGRRMVSSNS